MIATDSTGCPKTCRCFGDFGGNKNFACPNFEHKTISVKEESNGITIDCSTLDADVSKLLPDIKIGALIKAIFRNCPAPFNRILNRIGVRGIKNLVVKFDNGFDASNMTLDMFDGISDIKFLEYRAEIDHLPPKMLDKLTELTFLELGNNTLTHLSDGIFQYQKKLKFLNLRDNNFRNLSKDAFYGVTSNVQMDLSGNNIETLPPDVFYHLVNMTCLDLRRNPIKSLPEGLFVNNKNLEKIVIVDIPCELHTLPNGFLANLTSLRIVEIQCKLKILPENAFSGSMNLQQLILKDNALETLPPDLLVTQTNLDTLDLSGNLLTELPDNLFMNTGELRVLRLSRNRLTNVSG